MGAFSTFVQQIAHWEADHRWLRPMSRPGLTGLKSSAIGELARGKQLHDIRRSSSDESSPIL